MRDNSRSHWSGSWRHRGQRGAGGCSGTTRKRGRRPVVKLAGDVIALMPPPYGRATSRMGDARRRFRMRRTRFSMPRSTAVAPRVMAATSSPLAVAAALEVSASGGSAIDAAIAADAVLGVVQPMSTGLGGDLFALVEGQPRRSRLLPRREGERSVHGYNGSGAAPAAMTPLDGPLPAKGGATITVPGPVEAWDALPARLGQVELARCLEPAIRLAGYGFPVGPVTSAGWVASVPVLRD